MNPFALSVRRDRALSWSGGAILAFQSVFATALLAFAPFGLAASGKPARLVVQPSTLDLRRGEVQHGFIVTAISSDGSKIDVTSRSRFTSKQPKIISISTNGVCHALADGRAEILVAYNGRTEKVSVTATDTAQIRQPSFRQDVLPVLTKSGCNAGNCHGKLAGQNGFKLSLRGFAPEWD